MSLIVTTKIAYLSIYNQIPEHIQAANQPPEQTNLVQAGKTV